MTRRPGTLTLRQDGRGGWHVTHLHPPGAPVNASNYIIVVGNLIDGFSFYGDETGTPFPTRDAAAAEARRRRWPVLAAVYVMDLRPIPADAAGVTPPPADRG